MIRPRVATPPFSIAILGNDAQRAAAPATPVQLMHGTLAAGFDAVVPASLGDELVAGETLRLARLCGRRPVVQCACPFSLTELCKREANLNDVTVAVAPAPVALARALRLERTEPQHITYIGACPGANDPSIDLQVAPAAFLRGLTQKGIDLSAQPEVFSDRLPPDRRRYLSLPGGAPRADLVESLLRRSVVTLPGGMNPLLAVADAMFDGGVTLIDPAGAYHCVCAGSDRAITITEARQQIEAQEPLRSSSPIFEAPAWLDLRPTEAVVPVASSQDAEYRAPATFADAARISGGGASPASIAARPSVAAAEPVVERTSSGAAMAGASAASLASLTPVSSSARSSGTSPLHAPRFDREVPLEQRREAAPARDYVPTAPPAPYRNPTVDELLRRD